jgi:hypothetical protein
MVPNPSDLVEMIPKVEEPPEQSTTAKVAATGEMPPENAIQVGQFQAGVQAPDREYLKWETIVLLPPEPGKRQHLACNFRMRGENGSSASFFCRGAITRR